MRAVGHSGASIGYRLASIIAGGPAPLVATWLFATFNSTIPIGIYVVVCAIVSIISTVLLPDPVLGGDQDSWATDALAQVPSDRVNLRGAAPQW